MDEPTFKIEKGIPMPEVVQPKRLKPYPFAEMDIGDSFFVPHEKGTEATSSDLSLLKGRLTASWKYRQWKHELASQFSAVAVEGGVRVWCVGKDVKPRRHRSRTPFQSGAETPIRLDIAAGTEFGPSDTLRGAVAASGYLGFTRDQIYHLISANKIPHFHKKRSIMFRKAELIAWYKEQDYV